MSVHVKIYQHKKSIAQLVRLLVVTNLVPTSTISDIGGTKFDTYDTILMLSWYLKVQDLIPTGYHI